jgi:gliding motility-associated-like protein
MKSALKLFLILLLCTPKTAHASHGAGAELIYEWVSDSTYRFFFKFYRDCTGIGEDPSVGVCYSNTCGSFSGNFILNKMSILPNGTPNGSAIASGCPGYPTTCTSSTAAIPDYREWWYTNTVTLPSRCNSWHFVSNIVSRNISGNISPQNLTVEATLDNLNAQGNSSPYFSIKPVPYVCINQSYTYNNGAIDIDNDSIAYTIIQPNSIGSGNCPLLAPIPFLTAIPPYNLINNPFQTNNSFSFSPSTGNMSFIPAMLGPQTITVKVSEYRKHQLIGYVMRDIQIQVLNCTSAVVNMNIPSASITNALMINGVLNVCANNNFSFCYDIVATNSSAVLVVRDNHATSIPAASISYSGQAQDSIRGCFSWHPLINDTGLKVLSILVKDSSCYAPGIAVTQTFSIPIQVNYVAPPPIVTTPVYYCVGEVPGTLPVQGTNILWYNVPFGGTGTPTPPIINTSVTSTVTYYVSQNPNGCESLRTPLTIIVRPIPNVKIKLERDSVCLFDTITIRNIDTTQSNVSYAWSVDTGKYYSNSNNSAIVAHWSTPGTKKIVLTASLSSCVEKDSTTVYVVPIPTAFFEIAHDVCLGDTANLYPKEQDNTFYYWKIDDQFFNDTLYKSSIKLSWPTLGRKNIYLKVRQYYCYSSYDSSIYIHELPVGKIVTTDNNICSGGTISFHTDKNKYYVYEWTPQIFFNQNYLPDVIATVPYNASVFLRVTNQWGCSIYDSAYVNTDACCRVLLPDAFTPNGDGLNDKFHILTLPGQLKLDVFMIADRWGNIVFRTTNINEGWDGMYKNQPADMDTYFYYIKYTCNGEEGIKKGAITLIR